MDYVSFSLILVAAVAALHVWMRRTGREHERPYALWGVLVVVLIVGCFATEAASKRAHARIRQMVEGFPPTYAQEVERMGHAAITLNTPQNDPTYLAIIAAEIRWEQVNPSIADVYTMRKLPDGRNVLLVDSETDYDRNGKFEGEREERTAIGEVYEKRIPALEAAFAGVPSFMEETYSDRWGTWVSAFVPLHDAQGKVEGVLGVDYPAERWTAEISRARRDSMGVVLLLAIFLGAANTVISLLRVDIRNRTLAEQRVSQLNSELERRVLQRTAELEAAHERLVQASHRAGMAEVATGILHNVGNVVNSVNVAASTVSDEAGLINVRGLGKVCDLLREHENGLEAFLRIDPKGQKLREYLGGLSDHISKQQKRVMEELSNLRKNVEHIATVIGMQQEFSKRTGVVEDVAVSDLVDHAVKINAAARSSKTVELVCEYEASPRVFIEKHKVMQILVNLIRNARQACEDVPNLAGRVRVRVTQAGDAVSIAVIDNGAGIAPEHVSRIFGHGFTTKKNGHGFGLHSAALTAKELGGSLQVSSDGVGRGATFVLTIPGRVRQATAVAVPSGSAAA